MLEQLESSEFSSIVREQLWGWPLALTIHAFGTSLVVGFMLIMALRMLGRFKGISYVSLSRMVSIVWLALVVQIASGFVLWTAKPTRYVVDNAFLLKMALVVAGVILTIRFQAMLRQDAAVWDTNGMVSSKVVRFAAMSFVVWGVVLIAGKLAGFLGSIPSF